MSAKQCGTVTFMGTVTFRHDDPPGMPGLGVGRSRQEKEEEQREMVAVLAALSLLNKTTLLEKANAYMVGKLKARLQGFNRNKNSWKATQKATEATKHE
jgi:hypothetical protein